MALAGDQLALALRRDQLREEAVRAEVAGRSDAFKSALLESVSHDLRTPLASIRATADNLADPAASPSPSDVRAAAEGIDIEVERLDRLVRSILDLSRIGSGTLAPDLEVHDLAVLVESGDPAGEAGAGRTIGGVRTADGTGRSCSSTTCSSIRRSRTSSTTSHGIRPMATRVDITIDRPARDRQRLTIEDDGPGVPPDELDLIFDRFRRGPATRGEAGPRRGMGIGLSIVRGMTEAMGGTAIATRGRLGGLAVTLDLPAAHEPPVEGVA